MCALRAVNGGISVAEVLPGCEAEVEAAVTIGTPDADAKVGGAVGAVERTLAFVFAVPLVLFWLCCGVCNGAVDDCTQGTG